jgi:threonylcarbamoyladenosine tRNA methylthiotransferase MtaB
MFAAFHLMTKSPGRAKTRSPCWVRSSNSPGAYALGSPSRAGSPDGTLMSKKPTCRLLTLGCKVNQYDTQLVKETLEANGYREADPNQPADLCVVNTCTVTAEADAKARQLIRQLARRDPRTNVVVMGCYATREPETLRKLPGVAHVITDKTRLVDELRDFGVIRTAPGISRFDHHQRAFVKVQDGCLLNCTFCIIPSVRPSLRSRSIDEIEAEVYRLLQHKHREIVLCGIHLGHYGLELSRGRQKAEWTRLWHLLDRLGELPGDFRIRLSSLEAAEVRDDLIAAIARNPRVVPHLHICLQSGSDRILGLMRRRYRVASFLKRCEDIRRVLDTPALTTDVIVGFPGETEADFLETCRVVREVGFSRLHVFPFSPRRGTPAAALPGQLTPPVIADRKARLTELGRELTAAFARQLRGRRLEVLVERVPPHPSGFLIGTSCRHLPVRFAGPAARIRQLVSVRVVGFDGEHLLGEGEAPAEPRAFQTFGNQTDTRTATVPQRIPLTLVTGEDGLC